MPCIQLENGVKKVHKWQQNFQSATNRHNKDTPPLQSLSLFWIPSSCMTFKTSSVISLHSRALQSAKNWLSVWQVSSVLQVTSSQQTLNPRNFHRSLKLNNLISTSHENKLQSVIQAGACESSPKHQWHAETLITGRLLQFNMMQFATHKAANMPARNHTNIKCEASSISVGGVSQIGRKANLLSDLVSVQRLIKHFRKRNDF